MAITAPAWMLACLNRKRKLEEPVVAVGDCQAEVNGEPPEGLIVVPVARNGIEGDAACTNELAVVDAEYAEEFQSSPFTTEVANNPSASSSVQRALFENDDAEEESSECFCGICMDNKESWEMFRNDVCSHSFCYGCTSFHIETKIQDKLRQIPCPAVDCTAVLNFKACRLMIPDDILVEWDDLLCASLIPSSQKLYCPYNNCSALLVNDLETAVREVKCVACRRSFCAECLVPWHTKYSCEKFQKLIRKRGKSDRMFMTLAKRMNWQQCPSCMMYVEKTYGCLHINCRCGYDFCYGCGLPWSESHEGCLPMQELRLPPRRRPTIYTGLLRLFTCRSFK